MEFIIEIPVIDEKDKAHPPDTSGETHTKDLSADYNQTEETQ